MLFCRIFQNNKKNQEIQYYYSIMFDLAFLVFNPKYSPHTEQ